MLTNKDFDSTCVIEKMKLHHTSIKIISKKVEQKQKKHCCIANRFSFIFDLHMEQYEK